MLKTTLCLLSFSLSVGLAWLTKDTAKKDGTGTESINNILAMKELHVKKTNENIVDPKEIDNLMQRLEIEWHDIGAVNWPETFGYRPEVCFRMAHNGAQLYLEFEVTEQQVLADIDVDNGPVFKDACCEFFLQPNRPGDYYNFETNCMARMLIEVGEKRGTSRVKASTDILHSVKRWSSLQQEPTLPVGMCNWKLCLIIPASALFKHHIDDFTGREMYGNFYKTGDALRVPHYLSWAPIATPKPDFHRPEAFGKIIFE